MTYFLVAGDDAPILLGRGNLQEIPMFRGNRIKEGYEAMRKIYGKQQSLDDNRFAALAFFARDYHTAHDALTGLGDKWEPAVWRKKEYF